MNEGDIIYVPRHGISNIGYILQQITPFSTLLMVGSMMGII